MASKNPFGSLNIHRDQDEDISTNVDQSQASISSQTLFLSTQNQAQKKKKVRPEPKKVEDVQAVEEEFDQGFTKIIKSKGPVRTTVVQEYKEGEVKEKHLKNKGPFNDRNDKVTPRKREFDRKSGTGRGKEISKGGAGGKHTWGANPKNVAREEYNEDEFMFNNALNPKPRGPRNVVEEESKEPVQTPVQETVDVVEEKAPEEAPKQEETPVEEKVDENKEVTYEKRKKKGAIVEEKKEDLLERPENAVSLSEYMEKLKLKNQSLAGETKILSRVENSDLKAQVRDEDLSIGISSASIKNKNKQKEKKQDDVKEITLQFKTEDNEQNNYRERNQRGQGKKKNQGKFQFTNEDFPEF